MLICNRVAIVDIPWAPVGSDLPDHVYLMYISAEYQRSILLADMSTDTQLTY